MARSHGPLLAATLTDDDLEGLRYPLLGSPKVDGIRFMKPRGEPAMSRSWKPLPNRNLQGLCASLPELDFCDGEVIVGNDPAAEGLFNRTQSAVMTASDEQPLSLCIFDHFFNPELGFVNRTALAAEAVKLIGRIQVQYVPHTTLWNAEEVRAFETECIEAGYEGAMFNDPNAPYKNGRSTLKQGILMKLKRFSDDEAIIIGFEELERNQNQATKDSFGLQKRSSHRSGKIGGNTLGKFILEHKSYGQFSCGSGLDDATRDQVWQNKEAYLGKIVTFKYQAHGTKDKPRTPIFKGFRPEVE